MDETGIDNKSYYRKYGWSKKGQRIYTNDLSGKQFPRTTIIGALRNKEPIALLSFLGTSYTAIFNCWVKDCLLPELKENDVIVMDNARIHKSQTTRNLIESKGARLIFQPPYSPFLNKIENYWGFIKREIGLIKKNYKEFYDCVKAVFGMEYGIS